MRSKRPAQQIDSQSFLNLHNINVDVSRDTQKKGADMRFPKKDFFTKNKKVFIMGSAACLLVLIALLTARKQTSDGYANGYIICGKINLLFLTKIFLRR